MQPDDGFFLQVETYGWLFE